MRYLLVFSIRLTMAIIISFSLNVIFKYIGAKCVDVRKLMCLYSENTYSYTALCGCCGGQMGGLARRATYLVETKERLRDRRATRLINSADERSVTSSTSSSKKSDCALMIDESKNMTRVAIATDFLLFDCGNFTDPSTDSSFVQSGYTNSAYEFMCYDVVNIGGRELEFSQERVSDILEPEV